MGCNDYPRPERDVAFDRMQGLLGKLQGTVTYGRELLAEYNRRGVEIKRLTAVADAARALHAAADPIQSPFDAEVAALGAALEALEGGDRG